MNVILRIYRALFAWPPFFRLNKLLYRLSLSGMGVLNCENDAVSGERRFLTKFLKGRPGCVVFDVGANVGNYSRRVLDACPDALVYAFEPHPRTYAALENNVRGPNFFPVNAAAGEEDGDVSLFDYAARDGSSHASLFRDVIEGIHNAESVEHKVRVVALEAFAEDRDIERIDLLKIDTEGNELGVLKGLRGYLEAGRIAAIHFEFNEMNVSSRTYFRDFWELLPNYDFYRLLPGGMARIDRYVPVYCEIFAYQNIVAILKRA